MKIRYPLLALALATLPGPMGYLAASGGCTLDAMVVFDGSGSMSEVGFDIQDKPRIVDARDAVRRAMPQVTPYRDIGLIIYGPGPLGPCENIDLRFPPSPDAGLDIILDVDQLTPGGLTPLSASVARAAEVLGNSGAIVLVTDGNETCGGAPCTLGEKLFQTSRDLTVHVIGFKVQVDTFAWNNPEQKTYEEGKTVAKCLADRTGGKFVSTETVDELVAALQDTLGCPLIGGYQTPALRRRMKL